MITSGILIMMVNTNLVYIINNPSTIPQICIRITLILSMIKKKKKSTFSTTLPLWLYYTQLFPLPLVAFRKQFCGNSPPLWQITTTCNIQSQQLFFTMRTSLLPGTIRYTPFSFCLFTVHSLDQPQYKQSLDQPIKSQSGYKKPTKSTPIPGNTVYNQ